jgi:hypothetical protein
MAGNTGKAFRFTRRFVVVPAEEFDFDAVTDFLAEAMARAYAEDHPELFRPFERNPERSKTDEGQSGNESGGVAKARAGEAQGGEGA